MRVIPAVLLLLPACVRPASSRPDTTGPTLRVQVQNAENGPATFVSTSPPSSSWCARVRAFPGFFVGSANDPDGVQRLVFRVAGATIDRATIVTAPNTPDITSSVSTAGSEETLVVTLTPPVTGTVRTGVAVTFAVTPRSTSFAIIASGADALRNVTNLSQVDVYDRNSPVTCS